VKESKQ